MSKLRVLLVGTVAGGALTAGAFVPAFADNPTGTPIATPIGELHIHGDSPDNGAIVADGDDANPDPLDGSASLSGEGVCTSDDGQDPDGTNRIDDPNTTVDESAPSHDCNDEIITSQTD